MSRNKKCNIGFIEGAGGALHPDFEVEGLMMRGGLTFVFKIIVLK